MKFTTKTGRKVLGTLIAAAVMVSMIPAMVFAADATAVNARPTSPINAPGSATVNGINVAVAGERSNIGDSWGIGVGDTTAGGTYTFSIDERGAYAGYVITKIEINVTSVSNCAMAEGNEGWGTLAAGSPLTWTGAATNTVSLRMVATGSGYHTVGYSAITVYVKLAPTSATLTDMYFVDGDPAAPMSVSLLPENTAYTAAELTYTSSVESVATVAVSDGKVMVTPVGVGSTTITASLGSTSLGTATVTVYSPDEPVVTVNPSSLDLGLDSDPVTLTYTVIAPEDHEIEFAGFFVDEAGEGVIEVDRETGMVTPIGVGTATVYAGIIDWTLYDWFEGTCTVTVSEVAPDPEVPFYTEEQLRAMSVQNFVEGMYGTILNRQFDAAGRDSWMNLILEQNGTATAVAIGFLESPEFTSYNVSDEEFVATCYRVFCNRAATAAETAQWVAQLEGGATRDSVIRQFAQSPEWASICAFFKVNV